MTSPLPAYYRYARPEVVARVKTQGARILDVGCAAGAMGAALLANGAVEVVGLEREPRAAELARARLSAVHCVDLDTLPALPYPDGHFDAITCADVLEHLIEPAALLLHLRRYLRDDGMLVCSIPNVRHESVLVPLLVQGRFSYANAGILDRTHLRFYTRQEMTRLLTRSGYKVEGQIDAVTSRATPAVERLAQVVGLLGGDAMAFRAEAVAIQYLLRATPLHTLAQLEFRSS